MTKAMVRLVNGKTSNPNRESNETAIFAVLEGPYQGRNVTLVTKTYLDNDRFIQSIQICCCGPNPAQWENAMDGPIAQGLHRHENGSYTLKTLVRDAMNLAPVASDVAVDEEKMVSVV